MILTDKNKLRAILLEFKSISFSKSTCITPYLSVEDGAEYAVWRINDGDNKFVLKKAKACEIEVYSVFFHDNILGAPRFYESVNYEGDDYFLMECVDGKDLCRADRESITKALDALIFLQEAFWNNTSCADCGHSFEKSLKGRIDRGNYLNDSILEGYYARFLEEYKRVPRTLCHDDLLPFNVLVGDDKACLIDWEYGGILPYPVSVARLIAHGEENEDALFYMSNEDKSFAIDYYFDHLIKEKGIDYKEYRQTLDLFLLYEYCEWIMLGNKYEDGDRQMLEKYKKIACEHIKKMNVD